MRGFEVDVYELHAIPGGKARSYGVKGTAVGEGQHDLPAEHGFRFFPGYYKHVIATMAATPYWDTGETIKDRLVQVDVEVEASFRRAAIKLPAKVPRTIVGLARLWWARRGQPGIPVSTSETIFYARRLWQVLTSCRERRDAQYEQIPWWDFIDAERKSTAYQRYLGNMTRTLVAANPRKVSTRTNGNNWLQVLQGMFSDDNDRVLDGPTNEVWIYPWLKFLLGRGVRYYVNARATEILTDGQNVTGVKIVEDPKGPELWHDPVVMAQVLDCDRYGITRWNATEAKELIAEGDHYISAVPAERMAELVCEETVVDNVEIFDWKEIAKVDPKLQRIKQLSFSVQWMNGMVFYLKSAVDGKPAPTIAGHAIYVDAPFALTSIFQSRYWQDIDLSKYGDGTVASILSVDISEWSDATGRIYDKCAFELTRQQVKDEVWEDLRVSLRNDPEAALDDENLITWFLDFDIAPDPRILLRDKEPLLVNRVNTWRLRPQAHTGIRNLCIASDYVQTNTDLATMEGANEAARRAVNYILQETGSDAERCKIWRLEEPEFLYPFRAYDRKRFYQGQDWSPKFPILMKLRLFFALMLIGLGIKS
jgi:hypothetical protein